MRAATHPDLGRSQMQHIELKVDTRPHSSSTVTLAFATRPYLVFEAVHQRFSAQRGCLL